MSEPKIEILCTHCGTPVPPSLVNAFLTELNDVSKQFCCSGCSSVYTILNECNLEEYYRLKSRYEEGTSSPVQRSGKDFAGYDDPNFLEKVSSKLSGGLLEIDLFVEGTHCIACAWLIEKILIEREGAITARLDLGRRVVRVVFNPLTTKLSQLARALDRIGYPPHALLESTPTSFRESERKLLTQIGVAGAGAGNIMLLAFALYAGEYGHIEDEFASLFRWVSLGLALPVILYAAVPFYRGAYLGLINKIPSMDLPIALGVLFSFIGSTIATFQNRNEVYFDSTTMFVFLLLVGRFITVRANRWAIEAGVNLLDSIPKLVHRVQFDEIEQVPLSEIVLNDVIEIYPDEVVPVDGRLLTPSGLFSQSALTGESQPIRFHQNDFIYAGSIVQEQKVRIQTAMVGSNTRLAKLADLMERARLERAPLAVITDRISHWFVLAVISLAVVTFGIWWFLDSKMAVWHSIAMLVVTCPCALGIATPISFSTMLGFFAKHGMFLKGATVLERLAKINHIILDKTGTLTKNEMTLLEVKPLSNNPQISEIVLLDCISELERGLSHPIAKALQRPHTSCQALVQSSYHSGRGVQGTVALGDRNYDIRIGSKNYVEENLPYEERAILQTTLLQVEIHRTLVWVTVNQRIELLLFLGDALREDATSSIQQIKRMKLTIEILSGDSQFSVDRTAKELNIEVSRGDVSPEDKLKTVLEREARGLKVAMVGDGVNDAAALAAATCGISPAGSTDVARNASDVFLIENGIHQLTQLISISRQTMKRIHFNLGIAFAYNLIGASLAITGNVTPLVAAILMPLSSLTAIFIATYQSKKL